jgi:hypothetical protein
MGAERRTCMSILTRSAIGGAVHARMGARRRVRVSAPLRGAVNAAVSADTTRGRGAGRRACMSALASHLSTLSFLSGPMPRS